MQRHRQLSRRTFLSPQNHRPPLMCQSAPYVAPRLTGRLGRALTEVVLIILVPCFCLFSWALFDSEMRKSLLAAPNSDHTTAINPVFGFVKTENGTVISLHSQGQLRFWDLTRSVALGDMQSEISELRCGAYSPQERLLVVGSAMGKLEVRDLDHPEAPLTSQISELHEVSACQFTPDGKLLISAGEGTTISFWEPRTLERLHVANLDCSDDGVRTLAISDDGRRFLAATHNGHVLVWDVQQRRQIRKIRVTQSRRRPEASIEAVALLPGNQEFVAATLKEGIAVWNVETGECVRKFDEPLSGIRSGTLSEDGRHFIAGNDVGRLSVWDVTTGQRVRSIQQRPTIVRAVTCDKPGSLVMAGDWSGHIQWHPH